MPQDVRYLNTDDIIALHDSSIRLFGGRFGIISAPALESCVAQPMTAAFGVERFVSLIQKAAAYCFFIVVLHPFEDGNKRTGFLAALAFLQMNNGPDQFSEDLLYDSIMEVAQGRINVDQLAHAFERAVL